MMIKEITLIGTLPPIKGVSDYCIEQTRTLSKHVKINFFNFKNIYPEFLYPGGKTTELDSTFKFQPSENLIVNSTITWYNPFSWIIVGFKAKGDILHFHWWTYYLFPVFFTILLIAKLRRKKIICTIHNVVGHETGFFDKLFSKIIYLLCDKFVVHTRVNKQQLQNFFNVKLIKIRIIPHGIYDFYNDSKISKSWARSTLGIPSNAKVILAFGNIRPYKGIEDLIESFKIAKKSVLNMYLVIAGTPWNDSLKNSIVSSLKGVNSKKLFLKFIASSKVKHFFSAADLVVLPYKDFAAQSGPGNIALAFEKPLLVSDVGGLPDLVLNQEMIFESGNIQELATKLERGCADSSLLSNLVKDSIFLKKKYSWDNIAVETLKLYNELAP